MAVSRRRRCLVSRDEFRTKVRCCLETANEVYNIVTSPSSETVDKATKKLQSLESDGITLAELSKSQIEEFQRQEVQLLSQLEAHQKNKNKYETNKIRLERKKSRLQSSASSYMSALNNARESERRAEQELREAQERLERAERDEKNKQMVGTAGGALIGLLLGGPIGPAFGIVGLAVGIAAGAGISHIIIEEQGCVKRAEDKIRMRRNEVSDAQSRAQSANSSLRSTRSELNAFMRSIDDCDKNIQNLHNQIGALKNSKAFVMNTTQLWEHFTVACQNATERTKRLKKVVDRAQERREYRILQSNGTIVVARTFFEAWERITCDKVQTSLFLHH